MNIDYNTRVLSITPTSPSAIEGSPYKFKWYVYNIYALVYSYFEVTITCPTDTALIFHGVVLDVSYNIGDPSIAKNLPYNESNNSACDNVTYELISISGKDIS